MSEVGHNSIAVDQIRSIVERIQRLEEESAAVKTDIKEVYSEAKGNGFDVKALRSLVRLLKMDKAKAAEERAILELYASAMGYMDLV